MRESGLKAFRINLETFHETGKTGAITNAVESHHGYVVTACAIRNVVVYLAEGSLLPQIEAAVGTKPGDRVG